MSFLDPGVQAWLNWVELGEKTAELLRKGWTEEDIDLRKLIQDIAKSPEEAGMLKALLARWGEENVFGGARKINELRALLEKGPPRSKSPRPPGFPHRGSRGVLP